MSLLLHMTINITSAVGNKSLQKHDVVILSPSSCVRLVREEHLTSSCQTERLIRSASIIPVYRLQQHT